MRTIGVILKEARVKKKLSIESLSVRTKIRREFLDAIEKEEWGRLPEFPVVLGFVKSIAGTLKFDTKAVAALLKRDYPPKALHVNPKPDVSKSFVWSPKLTFLLGIVIVSLVVLGYLVFQYLGFISPPKLDIEFPTDDQVVTQTQVFVSGKTESSAVVKVNNQPVLVDDEGNFSTHIEVVPETKEVIIVAVSRSGKETTVSRKIDVNLDK
jgi:cytoskeletal protein RodZ